MANEHTISWFYESASEKRDYVQPRSSFGAFQKEGVKSIDDHFNDLYENYKENAGVDIKTDIKAMLSDRQFMESH